MNKLFKISTLGCKVNQYEGQVIRECLLSAGFKEAAQKARADICIVNTCTVTSRADSKSRNLIRQFASENTGALVVVTGCYVEKDKDAEKISLISGVDLVVKNADKSRIAEMIVSVMPKIKIKGKASCITDFAGHTRVFIKIQDGCNNRCSYCKVSLVRDKPSSRREGDIIREAKTLARNGFKEIVLCGICLGKYKPDLVKLLGRLEAIEGVERIRLSSIELMHVTKKLVCKIAGSKKLCPHLHIPLQSGDDRVLRRMNRRYAANDFFKKVKMCRQLIPDISITTDIMIGFPGEDEEAFKNTMKAVEKIKPSRSHIFCYSSREGTRAFCMSDKPAESAVRKRFARLKTATEKSALEYRKRFLGQIAPVLVHKAANKPRGICTGYTDTYIEVSFKGNKDLLNTIVPVKITV